MFTIRFVTTTVRPGLQVTLRTDVDGWDDDLPGEYENDAWIFRLPTDRYAQGMRFKFVLDEQYWMAGADLVLQPADGQVYDFGDDVVVFPGPTELVTENGVVPRKFFAPQLAESHVYDVVVIGSGIGGGVLADQLADSGLDVLVLEAGSYLFPTHVGNLPRRHAFGPQVNKNIWSLWDDFKITNYVNTPGSQFGGGQNGPSAAKPQVTVAKCPITPAEWATIEEVKNRIVKEVGGVALPGNDLVADRAGLGGVAHEAGTLRMDTDSATGVVDNNLTFHAYDNLYACDLSVFPTSPAANPTLTLAALSLRLARRLRAVL